MINWLYSLRISFFRTLSLVWLWIMALQWIYFMNNIWYSETTAIVIISVTVITAIEILLPIKSIYRYVLEGIAVLYIIHREMIAYWIYFPAGSLPNRIQQFTGNALPYLGFAVGAWILLLLSAKLVNNQRRILVFTGMLIVGFSILDSFTVYDLWKEVAWTVFAALGWLVSEHFRRFQQKYPHGWRYLRQYPLKMLLNVAVIFSLVFAVGVNMPEVPPSLTDPYTAWVVQGETAATAGVDGDPAESVMRTSSGYSRNDTKLGGGFNFDYTPVMEISSDQRSYWRGETRRLYTGNGWGDERNSGRETDEVTADTKLSGDGPTAGDSVTVRQTVTMLSDNQYPVLFGAYNLSKVELIDDGKNTGSLRWNSSQSELRWTAESKRDRYPKTYTVVSEVPVVSEDEIRQKSFADLYGSQGTEDAYLQVPNDFPKRARDLAEEVTASGATPYEKIGLLQNYLTTNYTYTNEPDLSKKVSDDFVDSFLFEIKEGYCDYFSTSMVMMARSLGIPARWVKGYAPGQVQGSSADVQVQGVQGTSDSGVYTVTNADAHSWAEVYFGPYGWIPVEATPGFSMPLLTHDAQAQDPAEPEKQPEVEEDQPEQAPQQAAQSQDRGPVVQIVYGASLLILAAFVVYVLWRNRLQLRFGWLRLRTGQKLSPDQKVIVMTERWIKELRRRGLKRGADETLRESVSRWEGRSPALGSFLEPLLQLFEKARYSPSSVSESEWRSVHAHAKELKAAMKKIPKNAA
ncbi:transglutaminase TgpA family protein [Paenibacillus cineris]|uniref:transglutaminase TgpA family protein n=1 Tax=Paenibacillus cineris TaxID=237530 RepID=UPI001B0604D6|nr:transglutaminase domain-containing protein [Paenibacillus cineris]GIO58593.1 hypothetical protein J43TS9_01670 [Paenibacillus cineris]